MTMVQAPPFGDPGPLQDLDTNLLSPLSFQLSNPDTEQTREPETSKRTAKRRQSSISERGKGSDGSKDQPRMLACLNCRQKKIKVCYPVRMTDGDIDHSHSAIANNPRANDV